MSRVLEQVTNAAILVAAAALAYRLLLQVEVVSSAPDNPVLIEEWRGSREFSTLIRETGDAKVTIDVVGDLECPACAGFHTLVMPAVDSMVDGIEWRFIHSPLNYHPNALFAAHVSECMSRAGRFEPFLDVVFAKSEQLAAPEFGSYIAAAGVSDTAEVLRCADAKMFERRIQAGLEFSKQIAIDGTPTVIITGWQYATPPSRSQIRDAVTQLKAGAKPAQLN